MDVVLVFSRPFDLSKRQTCPPLGVSYLAAVLEEAGFTVRIVDLSISDMDSSEAAETIVSMDPVMVGFSCTTPGFPLAARVAEQVNRKAPQTKIIFGGPFATFAYEEILSTCPWVDIIVRREGEYTLLDLAGYFIRKRPRTLESIAGIAYRGSNSIVVAPDRPFIENLDELPFPARHLLGDLTAYAMEPGIISSRGCPFGCAFCSSTVMWGKRTRFRSVDSVISEIRMLVKDFSLKQFWFIDDTFTLDKERALRLLSELEKINPQLKWGCVTRADMVDEELLRAMAWAGCISVQYGIESGSEKTMNLLGKKIFRDEVEKKVDMARRAGLEVYGSFVIGLPWETRDMVEETIEFAESLPLADAQINIAMPFLGTPLREELIPHFGSHIQHNDWENYHQSFKKSGVIIENPRLPTRDLLELCLRGRMINVRTSGLFKTVFSYDYEIQDNRM
jgi:anaerobic magnesium-protoporphyrin IX monomethyl ester cyclase